MSVDTHWPSVHCSRIEVNDKRSAYDYCILSSSFWSPAVATNPFLLCAIAWLLCLLQACSPTGWPWSGSISSDAYMHVCASNAYMANMALLRYQLILEWIFIIIIVIQSEPIVYHAEQVIDSELQRVELSHDDGEGDSYPFQLWLWVYETDMQARKTVYRSDMIWPNKQHEDVYICIGMTGRESDDERCLSDDMTVIFTENHSKGHRKAADRTQIKLPFTKINQFLSEEEAETRAQICNSACAKKRTGRIVGIIFGSIFGPLFLLALCICLPSCCSGAKSNSNGTGASRNPVHGKIDPLLTLDYRTEVFWMYLLGVFS